MSSYNRIESMARTEWTFLRSVAPNERCLSVERLKNAIRLSQDDDKLDETLLMYIDAATGQVEHDTAMALLTQTWVYGRDAFNGRYRFFDLPKRPATEIVSITYFDDEGQQQTFPAESYRLDQGRNQVVLQHNFSWPADVQDQIEVTFLAGYATPANVPAELVQAVALQCGKWVDNPTMDMPSGIGDAPYEMLVGRYMRSDYP